jgi:hypothetical protein
VQKHNGRAFAGVKKVFNVHIAYRGPKGLGHYPGHYFLPDGYLLGFSLTHAPILINKTGASTCILAGIFTGKNQLFKGLHQGNRQGAVFLPPSSDTINAVFFFVIRPLSVGIKNEVTR